jgi:hypothetical protein
MNMVHWWRGRRWRRVARRIESRIQILSLRCMLDVGMNGSSGVPECRHLRNDIAWEYVCLFHHLAKEVILDELNPERADEVLARIRDVLIPAWIEFELRMPGRWPTLLHRRDISDLASLRSRSLETSDELYEYVKCKSEPCGTPSALNFVLDAVGEKAAELNLEFDAEENARRLQSCSQEFADFVKTTICGDSDDIQAEAVPRGRRALVG